MSFSLVKDQSDTITLLDGTDQSVYWWQVDLDYSGSVMTLYYGMTKTSNNTDESDPYLRVQTDSGNVTVFTPPTYNNPYDEIAVQRDDVNATLSGFVTDVYNNWSAGDIPTEELVDPITAATELSQNYDGYQGQGAHAAMLGIPTTAKQSVAITVHGDTEDNDLLVDFYTQHVPTDADGNEVGFEKGMKYEPSTWSQPLYIAYEYTDSDGSVSSDFVQLEKPFTVNEITNKDGESVSQFKTESTVNQTADVTALKEELEQIRKEQVRLQEESQDDPSGGGGGFSFDQFSIAGLPGTGVVLAVVGAGAFLLGNN
jgi:hypothetical protein